MYKPLAMTYDTLNGNRKLLPL